MDGSQPRGLPHSWELERAVIGGLMTDATLFPEIAEILRQEDFSKPAHARLFTLMGQLHKRDGSCGLISVLDALEGSPALDTCGGAAYVVGMGQAGHVDTTVAEARQVRRHADHRRLIAALQDGLEDAHRAEDEDVVGSVSDRAVAAIAAVRDGAMAKVTYATPLADIDVLGREMDAAFANPGRAVGLPIDFADLEKLLIGWQGGKFYLLAARPAMGKTSAGEKFAIDLAMRGFPVGFFSMEMPRRELTMRGACMLGKVDSVKILKGVGDRDDMRRYAVGLEDMGRLPLYVDDTPGLSIGEFCSRARRMVKQDGVRAIFVDYIQLMKDPAALKRGNHEQEMASISQSIKGLTKTLDVPIIGLAQLNRGLEARANKRPMPSDLRECIAGDELLYDACTGDRVRMREVVAANRAPTVAAMDMTTMRYAAAGRSDGWSSGIKEIVRVRTATGRELRCSTTHPLLTIDGWVKVRDVALGTRIATPRVLPAPTHPENGLSADEVRLLGYLISDGSYGTHRSVSYTKADPVTIEDVRAIVLRRFGIKASEKPCRGDAVDLQLTTRQKGPGGNPLILWLKALGIHGQLGQVKRVPDALFRCDNALVAEFIGALWAGDGCVVPRSKGGWVLKFTSTSRGLLFDVQHLLLRLGIVCVVGRPERNTKSTMDIATINIGDADQIQNFARVIPIPGVKGDRLAKAAAHVGQKQANHHVDRFPLAVTGIVKEKIRAAGMSWREVGYRCQGKEMCRRDLARVAAKIEDSELAALASSEVLWDEIVSIDSDGTEETFDITVPGPANFVVSDITAKNSGSLEQDADVIMFIYRDEVYNPDTADKGLSEIIVAKHRGGPTGMAKLVYRPEFTLFQNYSGQQDYR